MSAISGALDHKPRGQRHLAIEDGFRPGKLRDVILERSQEEVGGLVRILLGGLLKPTLKLLNVVLSKACDGFPNRSSRLVGRSLRPARTRRSIAYATVTGNLFNGFCHLSIEDRTAALSPHAPLRLQWSGHGDEHSFHHRASAYHSDVDTGVRAGANSTCVRPIHAGGSYVD